MINNKRGPIGKLILIIIAILLIIACLFYYQKNNTPVSVSTELSKCGFKVTSLTANEKVSFPLTVQGVVDNSKTLGCSWQMFEGQAGVAKLYSYNNGVWSILGSNVPIKVDNWMATTTAFEVVLDLGNSSSQIAPNTPIKIVFSEENPSGQGKIDSLEIPVVFGTSDDIKKYINSEYHFSFSYPKEFTLADSADISGQPWQYNTTDQGTLLTRVLISRTAQPKTNFGEAYFDVGISTDTVAVKNCLISSMGNTTDISSVEINNQSYEVFHYTDAGAGNIYDITSYHTLRNGKCFVLESMVHSSNIGNYSPEQGIKEFDKPSIDNILKNITDSYQFLN